MAEDELELEDDGADDGEDTAKSAGVSGGAGSGRSKTILVAAIVACLLGANVFLLLRTLKPESPVEVTEQESLSEADADEGSSGGALVEEGAVLPLDTLLVNLTDEEKPRFVRARVELVFSTQGEMEAVKESAFAVAKAKHVALSLLATKHSSELADIEGRGAFRQELVRELSKNLKGTKVVDVLLTDFIIQ